MATATRKSPRKRFYKQNNCSSRALSIFAYFFIFPFEIVQVRYIINLTWLRGFQVKAGIIKVSFVRQFQRETWTQKTPPNMEGCPESLGAMLAYM